MVSVLAAVGFFGLDQVGTELECPFGTDWNDFAILKMGHALCNDLDAILRTLRRERYRKRLTINEHEQKFARMTAQNMGW